MHLNCYLDINDVNLLPSNIDIFTYSFPCQDISQQGKQKGINEQTDLDYYYKLKEF
ncbi:DNA cytosine methyltransferase [Mycoplasmopsis felis]|uniref:DNA cytosine methyltransferase n=1 Tax=Mycoplasmopsis felis TaxID=33923 RepID=UPI003A4D538F